MYHDARHTRSFLSREKEEKGVGSDLSPALEGCDDGGEQAESQRWSALVQVQYEVRSIGTGQGPDRDRPWAPAAWFQVSLPVYRATAWKLAVSNQAAAV